VKIIGCISSILLASAAMAAQTFVASVKRETDVVPGMTFSARGATVTVVNNELANVIDNAYGIRRYQLVGAPDWVDSDRYNIRAKAAADVTREELMLMVQSLLAERFKLKVHRETREMPIYILKVSKAGLTAPRAVGGTCATFDPRTPGRAAGVKAGVRQGTSRRDRDRSRRTAD
jgi:uncharacterized protein (TIGR03435 family)